MLEAKTPQNGSMPPLRKILDPALKTITSRGNSIAILFDISTVVIGETIKISKFPNFPENKPIRLWELGYFLQEYEETDLIKFYL